MGNSNNIRCKVMHNLTVDALKSTDNFLEYTSMFNDLMVILTDSAFRLNEDYLSYLTMASRLHNHSVDNVLLTLLQDKEATNIKSRESWEKKGCKINEDSIGMFNVRTSMVMTKINNDRKMAIIHKPIKVYDVSETYGKVLEPLNHISDHKIIDDVVSKYLSYMNRDNPFEFSSVKYAIFNKFKLDSDGIKFSDVKSLSQKYNTKELHDILERLQRKIGVAIGVINKGLEERQKKTLFSVSYDIKSYKEQCARNTDENIKNSIERGNQHNDR